MVDENDVFDVIVIGAAPAGQTAAARAAREAFAAHQPAPRFKEIVVQQISPPLDMRGPWKLRRG